MLKFWRISFPWCWSLWRSGETTYPAWRLLKLAATGSS
jgi:hypothetical protein